MIRGPCDNPIAGSLVLSLFCNRERAGAGCGHRVGSFQLWGVGRATGCLRAQNVLDLSGKATEDSPWIWDLATPGRDPEEAPDAWLWQGLASAAAASWEMNQWMKTSHCLSPSLLSSPGHSAFQINLIIIIITTTIILVLLFIPTF